MITANDISRLIVLAERVRFDQRKVSKAMFANALANLRLAWRYAMGGNACEAKALVESAYLWLFV